MSINNIHINLVFGLEINVDFEFGTFSNHLEKISNFSMYNINQHNHLKHGYYGH